MRLCEFIVKLCEQDSFRVLKPVKSEGSPPAEKHGAQQYSTVSLSCQEKIHYCQLGLDAIATWQQTRAQQLPLGGPQQELSEYFNKLNDFIDTFRYQIKIIGRVKAKKERLDHFERRATTPEVKQALKEKKEKLQLDTQMNLLDTANQRREDLYTDFVEKLGLFELIYEQI